MHQRDRVTPYFDLFDRLDDASIARLAEVDTAVVSEIRPIVESIAQPLVDYASVLGTLSNTQVSRAFGLPEAAVNIWRRCAAPDTLSPSARAQTGVLDEIMGPADSDIMIAVEEDVETSPSEASTDDLDWGDL